ncbi:Oidioi.mRNA.OKI2018_I69.PAR.g11461.t1.cds [Oikopleura dioica]|uniref:Oidioi.mRNA.OKI2018_I69.PAR.g11461.t1.cds n=1 Tax=Oikopleura dioica TaxID=34765 RepID=A0ABN7S0H7_OIKDI|nr:Oidioi.mRNA.OKI2018_I69.PAR.g11461.t1.cds [Oikopleura dioica]
MEPVTIGVWSIYGAFFALLMVVAGVSCYAKRQLAKRGVVNPIHPASTEPFSDPGIEIFCDEEDEVIWSVENPLRINEDNENEAMEKSSEDQKLKTEA